MPTRLHFRIFISHSHTDLPFVEQLARDLRQALGGDEAVWYDASNLEGGDQWWRTIVAEIYDSTVFLIICTPEAMASEWVNDEIDIAWQLKNGPTRLRLIPLLYQHCELRLELTNLQHVNFITPEAYLTAFQDLLLAVKGAQQRGPVRQLVHVPQNQQQTISYPRRRLLIGVGIGIAAIATGTIVVPQLYKRNISGSPSPTSSLALPLYHITSSRAPDPHSSRSWPLVYTDNGPSNSIIVIQQMLLAHNQPPGSHIPYNLGQFGSDNSGVDGLGGPMTMQATREFQQKNQCYPSGLIDPVTWEKLIKPSKEKDSGYQVKALQVKLNEVLSLNIPTDGIYTAQTRDAVKTFQERNMHLPLVRGDADMDTWCLLLNGKLNLPPIRSITDSKKDSLHPFQTLDPGYQLTSRNGQFALIMQDDGELLEKAVNGQILWISCTSRPGTIFWNQNDGNMTLRAPVNHPIWSTKTDRMYGAVLTIQDDGHLVINFPNQPNRPPLCVSCQSGWHYISEPEGGWT